MDDLVKLARVYIWSGAAARVMLAAAPLVGVVSFAMGGVSISIEGGAA